MCKTSLTPCVLHNAFPSSRTCRPNDEKAAQLREVRASFQWRRRLARSQNAAEALLGKPPPSLGRRRTNTRARVSRRACARQVSDSNTPTRLRKRERRRNLERNTVHSPRVPQSSSSSSSTRAGDVGSSAT